MDWVTSTPEIQVHRQGRMSRTTLKRSTESSLKSFIVVLHCRMERITGGSAGQVKVPTTTRGPRRPRGSVTSTTYVVPLGGRVVSRSR